MTAKLFDSVPLDQITDAERSLREAAADIPQEVLNRFDTAEELSDEDREKIVQIASKVLARFQHTFEPESKQEAKTDVKAKSESKA